MRTTKNKYVKYQTKHKTDIKASVGTVITIKTIIVRQYLFKFSIYIFIFHFNGSSTIYIFKFYPVHLILIRRFFNINTMLSELV